ncbi:LPS export ABC transporter periplasmic protein LptC [Pontimicrobium aquaticum]|nr:LPS export ABC transporter periplasmic protein LptC [Pontimicrobium aquaticum]
MNSLVKHIISTMVTALTVTMFFSCRDNFKDVQNIGLLSNKPITEADNINTKYTDSGKLKSHLVSPKMLDFSNREFSFVEFPQGIDFTIYDDKGNKSNVVANFAMIYNDTDLIDLQGNVILTTHTNDTLFTEQLFYDQKQEWMFTNKPVKFRQKDQIMNGTGFDSNKNFTNARVLEMSGVFYVDE